MYKIDGLGSFLSVLKVNPTIWTSWFIGFCGVFVFCLLLVVFLVTNTTRKIEESNKYENNEENSETFDVNEYYDELETTVYDATKEYVNDNPKLIEKKDYFKLNIDTLIKNGYIVNFEDGYGEECSGYVDINNDGNTTYSVYIKCSEYETIGYDERKAFNE